MKNCKLFFCALLCAISISSFAFQDGDYVLISYTNDDGTYYLTDGVSGYVVTKPTINSVWLATASSSSYYLENIGTGKYLSNSGNSLVVSSSYTTWSIPDASSNASTVNRSINSSTYYLRYSASGDKWQLNNASWSIQTLNFTVLTKNTISGYSEPSFVVKNATDNSETSYLDFDCNTSSRTFDIAMSVIKGNGTTYTADGINISTGGTPETVSDKTSLEKLFEISCNANDVKDDDLIINYAWSGNKIMIDAPSVKHFASADKEYKVTLTLTAKSDLEGGNVHAGDKFSAVVTFYRKAYTRNTTMATDLELTSNPTAYTFNDYHSNQTTNITISGSTKTWQPGQLVYYNGSKVEECSQDASGGSASKVITLTDDNTTVKVLLEDGTVCPWCEASVVNGKIRVTTIQDNMNDASRTAEVRAVITITDESATYKSTMAIQLTQPGTLPVSGNQFIHNLGYTNIQKGLGYDDHGQQQTHIYESTLYMIPGSNVKLVIKEKDFPGWQRWYDYDTGYDVEATGTTYATAPTYTRNGTYAFKALPTGVSSTSTASRGRYYNAMSTSNIQSYLKDPVVKTPADYAANPHTIACDISNYTDYDVSNTAAIKEPTLSYRSKFNLRPASEMAEKMEATVGTTNAVEEYKVILPTTKIALLPTTWRYQTDNADSTLNCYIYKEGTKYKRVGITGVGAKWYVLNGTTYSDASSYGSAVKLGFDLNARNTAGTITFVLRTSTAVNGKYYNLVKYVVSFQDIAKVGPVAENATTKEAIITMDDIKEKYNVLALLDFNYNGETVLTTKGQRFDEPLGWDEATFGYAFSSDVSVTYNRHQAYANSSYDCKGPAWGEYTFINMVDPNKNTNWIYTFSNHDTRDDAYKYGYFMYCDGTQIPGKVCALQTDAYLCAGEKIYCSAFVVNTNSKNLENSGKPLFKFVIEGRKANATEWKEVSQYMTGYLDEAAVSGKSQTSGVAAWQQIRFEVELDDQYEEFRISVWNFGTASDGNDFAIDDICIYSVTPPLIAYQTASACHSSEDPTQLVFRVDCFSDAAGEYKGKKMWFNIVDDKTNEQKFEEGIVFPTSATGLDSQWKNTKLKDFLDNHKTVGTHVAYIKENVGVENRYVMYIVRNQQLPGGEYTMHMVMGSGNDGNTHDYTNAKCANKASFKVFDAIEMSVGSSSGVEGKTDELCANAYYNIAPTLHYITVDEKGNQVDNQGYCYNDWLLGIDETTCKAKTGYEYNDVIEAIQNDLRAFYFDDDEKTLNENIDVTNVTEIDTAYMKNVEEDYPMILDLVSRGFLKLHQKSLDIYMPAGSEDISFIALPIFNTQEFAAGIDDVALCTNPVILKVGLGEHLERVHIATTPKDDMPAHLQSQIPVARFAKSDMTGTVTLMPIQELQNLAFADEFRIVASSDPAFDAEESWCAFTPDRKFNKSGDLSSYYKPGQSIKITRVQDSKRPAGKKALELREGYTYTLEMPMQSELGETTIHYVDRECPIGSAYINIYIVPEYVKWNPGRTDDNNWSNDDNWQIVDKDGNPLSTNARGFAPLAHTNVIIDNVGDNSSYPVIDDYSLTDVIAMYKEGAAQSKRLDVYYDYGFLPHTCNNILFRENAMMLNQDRLNYEKAYVDMALPNKQWAIVSPAMKGIVSGDMYVPNDADAKSEPFDIEMYDGVRNKKDFAFFMALYSRATKHECANSYNSYTMSSTEWSGMANGLAEAFPVGSGVAIYGCTPTTGDHSTDEKVTVRLPKKETAYNYFNAGVVATEVPAVKITRPDDYGKLAYNGQETITLTNQFDSRYFVFGNPTMAYIDMFKFLEANGLSTKFYYLNNNSWQVASKKSINFDMPERMMASGKETYYLPPMRAVLIENSTNAKSIEVKITRDMLSVQGWDKKATDPDPAKKMRRLEEQDEPGVLNIYASNKYGTSYLAVGESDNANDGYMFSEDAELITTNNCDYSSNIPYTMTNIYSISGDKSLSMDVRKNFVQIPLAFAVNPTYKTKKIHLLIDGVHNFDFPIYLVDSYTNEKVQLLNGIQFDLALPADGEVRYYLQGRSHETGDATGLENTNESNGMNNVSFLSHKAGEITVLSENAIESIAVYDISGRMIVGMQGAGNMATVNVPQGIAVVEVETNNEIVTGKVFVK